MHSGSTVGATRSSSLPRSTAAGARGSGRSNSTEADASPRSIDSPTVATRSWPGMPSSVKRLRCLVLTAAIDLMDECRGPHDPERGSQGQKEGSDPPTPATPSILTMLDRVETLVLRTRSYKNAYDAYVASAKAKWQAGGRSLFDERTDRTTPSDPPGDGERLRVRAYTRRRPTRAANQGQSAA